MPTIISPLITDAGLAAAIAASGLGMQLTLTHVALGSGQYTPANAQTTLTNRKEKITISAGIVTAGGGFKLSVLFPAWAGIPNPYNATEIGFYAGDPDSGGVLFAVFSHPSAVIVQRNALDYVAQFALQLSRVPAGSVTVQIDPAGAQSLALIAAHEAAVNPHPQYVRNDAAQGLTTAKKLQSRANINAQSGGNVTTVNAGNSPFNLTEAHAGLVLLDAAAGAIVANLPAANSSTQSIKYQFYRTDSTTANSATVNRAGADTVDLAATSFALTSQADFRAVESDTTSKWRTIGTASGRRIAQRVNLQTSAYATGTNIIPLDDTIPQQTEGDQYLSQAITPTNAASTLRVDVTLIAILNTGSQLSIALFRDATANALAAIVGVTVTPNDCGTFTFSFEVAAGSTAATTFKVRAGPNAGATTLAVNGRAGSRIFGGVAASSITITEYLP
jgi:hypothetical protein